MPKPILAMINISLNGQPTSSSHSASLQTVLLAHGYVLDSAFACAINNTFVPRQQWDERVLQNGDRIDVVTPITGG